MSTPPLYGHIGGTTPPKPKVWPWVMLAVGLALCVAGYGAYRVYSRYGEYKAVSRAAVDHFHQQMDAETIAEIVEEAAPAFRESAKKEELEVTLKGMRDKLGTFKSSTQAYMQWNTQMNVGTTLTVRYDSEFSSGPAEESFVFLLTDAGPKLYGYNVRSAALLKN